MSMNVAVPPLQHSAMLGQCASAQTVVSLFMRIKAAVSAYSEVVGGLIFSHSGFFKDSCSVLSFRVNF
jgi:hypothetical protein